jgi:spermidine synthase
MDASYVDLADPTHLEFDYLRWMRLVVRAAGARRIIHIGGGACALPRALATADPDGRQAVCESNREVISLAREHLGLRRAPGLRVRHVDGRAFVAEQADATWDAVVIDAFVGAAIPPRLVTVEALADVARVAPLALVNVVDSRSAPVVRQVAAGLAAVYPRVWGLGHLGGNTVVIGARRGHDLDRISAQAAADPSRVRLMSRSRLTQMVAGMAALSDADHLA